MKSVSQYQEEKAILDQALASGGGTVSFETHGQAIHFRQRIYTFRKLFRENASPKNSPYDRLTLPQLAKGQTDVEIKLITIKGVFTPANIVPPSDDIDDMFAEAKRLAGDIL